MCSFMLICQCCFAIVKVLLKKVTYLLTYLTRAAVTLQSLLLCVVRQILNVFLQKLSKLTTKLLSMSLFTKFSSLLRSLKVN